MFISDSLIYLELQKTGCTHTAKLLAQVLPGKQVGKHNRLPRHLANDPRPIIGSIRNPWDWYISLWAYGCDRKGALYHRLTSRKGWWLAFIYQPIYALSKIPVEVKKPQSLWRSAYRSSDDPQCFREWLYLIHDADRREDIGEDYAETSISEFAGLMTYRYLLLFSRSIRELFTNPEQFKNLADVQAFDQEQNLLRCTIRNEQLEDDLIQVLQDCGVRLSDEQIQQIRSGQKTNTSSRKRSIEYYYDRDTIELVRAKEQFILEKYGYPTPDL